MSANSESVGHAAHDGIRVGAVIPFGLGANERSAESGGDEIECWNPLEHVFRQAEPDLRRTVHDGIRVAWSDHGPIEQEGKIGDRIERRSRMEHTLRQAQPDLRNFGSTLPEGESP